MTWLLDTLVWTGALIVLVLLLRRTVAHHFGARTAYALWFLPLLRLVMPPLVLPAPDVPAAALASSDLEIAAALEMAGGGLPLVTATVPASSGWWPEIEAALIAAWLAGAAIYIVLRLMAYRRLRAELLAGSRGVGEVGSVRLVETPATRSPLAFGLIDKVIALPVGFMSHSDRAARDLALAHEIAHHRAHDLLANFAALPLFSLHWFNPLSWLGWHAMRRDQEAACDARVVEGRDRLERAHYAALIARVAATPAPRAALAAPMACPVLGDKSIIHRLRNLTMSDISLRRRRMGGAFIGLAALALPLTASITYAQANADDEADLPVPPAPPTAPVAPLAPDAPDAPFAPAAPPVPLPEVDPSGDGPRVMVFETSHGKGSTGKRRVMILRETSGRGASGSGANADDSVIKRVIIRGPDGKMLPPDSPEFEAHMKKLEERFAKLDPSFKMGDERFKAVELRARQSALAAAKAGEAFAKIAPRVEMSCDNGDDVSASPTSDGRLTIRFCRKFAMEGALSGLRSARATIAGNTQMSSETRREVLQELDREIERIERDPNG